MHLYMYVNSWKQAGDSSYFKANALALSLSMSPFLSISFFSLVHSLTLSLLELSSSLWDPILLARLEALASAREWLPYETTFLETRLITRTLMGVAAILCTWWHSCAFMSQVTALMLLWYSWSQGSSMLLSHVMNLATFESCLFQAMGIGIA